MSKRSLRWMIGRSLDGEIWRTSHARFMRDQFFHVRRNESAGFSDADHLLAAAEWLGRAQDVTGDGGVSGRYSLRHGWSSSYPETTGYIIPTFLALAKHVDSSFHERAAKCVRFLHGIQLPDGAFPGGELHENRSRPSVFNTAQILHGLVSWHAETGDIAAAESASRAAAWLSSQQDPDGCWRTNIYNLVTTYSAHASCWLAEAGRHFGVEKWVRGAERHLDWALGQVDPETGWIDGVGFSEEDHRQRRAVTHTIAYTIWGILHLAESLRRNDALEVACRAADQVARRLELSGWLPGVLDSRWRPVTREYACLTGNAQMALIWFRAARAAGDTRLVNAGLKALDLVKLAQPMDSRDPGIRGGIPGSAPVWGDYLYMALPNWSAKYFIDAMLEKRNALEWMRNPGETGATAPSDVPRGIASLTSTSPVPLKIVLLASPESHKIPQMTRAWAHWGFKPAAVLIEHRPEPTVKTRVGNRLREEGFIGPLRRSLANRSRAALSPATAPANDWAADVAGFCADEGIPCVHVGPLSEVRAIESVKGLEPDILVHAGAGILRPDLLAVPRLGTLNAHMGILPRYRGMNVAEWASLEGNRVGCTVHLINPGIDTGDILAIEELDTSAARDIKTVRAIVDDAQIALLGRVLQYIVARGALPPKRPQASHEGRQYFEMHRELRAILETRLKAAGNHAHQPSILGNPGGVLVPATSQS